VGEACLFPEFLSILCPLQPYEVWSRQKSTFSSFIPLLMGPAGALSLPSTDSQVLGPPLLHWLPLRGPASSAG
jgi:hypothetical protein